jgi:tRNA (cmo5U34)-methyltransferase
MNHDQSTIDRLTGDGIPRNWTFEDAAVAKGFDRHVRETLPWYEMATGAIAHLGRHYIPQHGTVYDIGASTGNIAKALSQTLEDRKATYIGIESSQEMVKRFQPIPRCQCVHADALTYDFQNYDFAVCFLVLMFLPVSSRGDFLRSLAKKIIPGGALVIFDKLDPSPSYLGTVMRRLTLAGKVAAGITSDEIIAKELSLGGVQRPITPDLIHSASPHAVQFFAFGEFAGWIIEGASE